MTLKAPWLKSYGDVKHSLTYPKVSISRLILDTAKANADSVAVTYMSKSITYKQLSNKITELAGVLYNWGVRKGDRVMICLPNILQAVYGIYAVNLLGAVAVMAHPLSAQLELTEYINKCDCKYIITLNSLEEKFLQVFKATGCKNLLVTSPADELSFTERLAYELKNKVKLKDSRTLLWRKVLNGEIKYFCKAEENPDSTAVIIFSGGTTGTPKAVKISNMNLNAVALQTGEMCHSEVKGIKMLSVLPIFHGFGLGVCIHTVLAFGSETILVPRFNADSLAKTIVKHKPHYLAGVPAMYKAIMESKKFKKVDLKNLLGVFSGGDSLSQELKESFDSFLKSRGANVKIRQGYGASECVAVATLMPYNKDIAGSVGIPLPDTYFKITDSHTMEEKPPFETGEICICGKSVMKGYLDDKTETQNALRLHSDGNVWLHTGDLGYMDSYGFVYFTQRAKRVIVSNGYNIYPAQIESALMLHKGIMACCVVGVEDSKKANVPVAFIVAHKGSSKAELKGELMLFLSKHLSRYSMPKEIYFTDSLPVTQMGKTDYKKLELIAKELRNKKALS